MSDSRILTADEYVYGNIAVDPVPEELPGRRKRRKVQTESAPLVKPKTSRAYHIVFTISLCLLSLLLVLSIYVRSIKMTVKENI